MRTCNSASAGKPQSVVSFFSPDIRSVFSSLQSVLREYSKGCVRAHACVRNVSSPIHVVVYTRVSPSVTYAQAVKSCLPTGYCVWSY